MKKLLYLSLILLAYSIGFSQKKKVAIVTFYSDKVIDISKINSTADFIAKNTKLSEDPNFNLSEPLNDFHKAFLDNYVKEFDFELIPEKDVLELSEYMSYNPQYSNYKNIGGKEVFETIEGYKAIRVEGSRLG